MKNTTDRRSDMRRPLKQPVSFEYTTTDSELYANLRHQGIGIDLSSGGIGLMTERQLAAGEIVRLFLPVTDDETKVPVFTQVMWSSFDSGEFRTGLRFLA